MTVGQLTMPLTIQLTMPLTMMPLSMMMPMTMDANRCTMTRVAVDYNTVVARGPTSVPSGRRTPFEWRTEFCDKTQK